jgi:hypothetical protein
MQDRGVVVALGKFGQELLELEATAEHDRQAVQKPGSRTEGLTR